MALDARAVLYSMWQYLPLELAINVTIAVTVIPAAVVLRVSPLLAVPVAALCLAPVWMGAVTAAGAQLDGCLDQPAGAVTYGAFLQGARRHAGCGWALAAVPTALLLAARGTLSIMDRHPQEAWLLAPLLADGALLVILGMAGLYVFPLGAMTALRGRDLWIGALACAAAAPAITIASCIVIIVLLGVTAVLGPGLLVAWPAPLALYLVAMSKSAAGRLEQRRAMHADGAAAGQPPGML